MIQIPGFDISDILADNTYMSLSGESFIGMSDLHHLGELTKGVQRKLRFQQDMETLRHIDNEQRFAYRIAQDLGFSDFDIAVLLYAVAWHDVGKAGLRRTILKKEGILTSMEFNHIKEHVGISIDMVESNPHYKKLSPEAIQLIATPALEAIAQHHWYHDGKGYGVGLAPSPTEQPSLAAVMWAADALDAMLDR